jgi:hypothetical protein
VDPTVGLNSGKRKMSCTCRESNPARQVRNASLYRLHYPRYLIKHRENFTFTLDIALREQLCRLTACTDKTVIGVDKKETL